MNPKIDEVCRFLRPKGGFTTNGTDYEGIVFFDCEPFTKDEYEAAIPLTVAKLEQQANEIKAKREAALSKLAALGLTADDLRALGL